MTGKRNKKPHNSNEGRHIKWDKGVDLLTLKIDLGKRIKQERALCGKPDEWDFVDDDAPVSLAHYCCLLTQLLNCERGSEAHDSFVQWVRTGNRAPESRVRKVSPACTCGHSRSSTKDTSGHKILGVGVRGQCKVPNCSCRNYEPDKMDIEMRQDYIPPEVSDEYLVWLRPVIERGYSLGSYETFSRRHAVNTHATRFSALTHMAKNMHMSITEIAKVSHHRNVNQLVTYFEEKEADKAHRALAGLPPLEPEKKPSEGATVPKSPEPEKVG